MNYWQAHAKLRLHTDSTLSEFKEISKEVGNQLRRFAKRLCSKYLTKELPREVNARGRRTAKLVAKGQEQKTRPETGSSRMVKFNINTYKAHSLPDYPETIHRYGTTDNYTTQSVRFLYCSSGFGIFIKHFCVSRESLSINDLKHFTCVLTSVTSQYRSQNMSVVNARSGELVHARGQ